MLQNNYVMEDIIDKVSPMMQHYIQTKIENKDCILFYRLGDFYEMFFDDAITVSRELELTLTGKSCGLEERAPMCGVPFHAVDQYISRLVEKGYKIAVCSSSALAYVKALIATCSTKLEYDVIICGDMVKHAKPDPEIFLRGAEELGVDPENCMVLEDSKQGILAARAAGMHRCFIPDTITPDEVMKEALEFETPSLFEVITLLESLQVKE